MAFAFKTQYAWDNQPTEAGTTTPAGFYPAKIVGAEEKYSRGGKPMLQLTLEVDPGGTAKTVDLKEYLLLTPEASWKIEQYMAAIGMQFGSGQDVTISASDFLGGQLFVLTFNEPGVKNPERLYMKAMKAFRARDVKAAGPLNAEALEYWGLNPDGTRKGGRDEQRANAQPWQGQQPQQQGGWGQQPQRPPMQPQGWNQQPTPPAQPGYKQGQGAPAPMPNEMDDDIPF